MSGDTRSVAGACPLDCQNTCSWIVTVKNGEAIALRGDPAHPFTRGCSVTKWSTTWITRDLPPACSIPCDALVRRAAVRLRASRGTRPSTIAGKLREAIATHGGEAIWPYLGSGNVGLIQGAYSAGQRFWNVLGASRHFQNICTIAGGYGTVYHDNRVQVKK
jgi:hypothetical protein